MNYQTIKIINILIAVLIIVIVINAIIIQNFYLVISGVLIGTLFLFLVRIKFRKQLVDERIENISGKAAWLTNVVFTFFLGTLALFLILSGQRDDMYYVESLGVTLSYVVMLNLTIYVILYHYFKKNG